MSNEIKNKAFELGFDLCGIAPVRSLEEYRDKLYNWIDRGFHAGMHYMARNLEKRINPALLVDNARSVIVVGMNYYRNYQPGHDQPVFARYALGQDYHHVLKERLNILLDFIKRKRHGTAGRVFVDTAPVLERVWAIETGLGWAGKNSMLINREIGSFFFIGVIIINTQVEYDTPELKDYCGNCRKCIDTCPTGAILENRMIDSNKCLSYMSIEHRGKLPPEYATYAEKKVFGCDICQEVCPWNNKVKESTIKEFEPLAEILNFTTEQWRNITEEEFFSIFKESAVLRSGYMGFMRNIMSG
ncbi:MAG: tRNA epoxyqueuosine(34) reductase QueG [Bacteroidales bacterium]|nr:tRNA epoxyqueuosine(34) reductase QueG [Bacteroidales bacterium]